MLYVGYIATTKPFADSNLQQSTMVYNNKVAAENAASDWFEDGFITKVSVIIDNPFINDPKDPFIDIGKFRSLLSPDLYRQLAQSFPEELTETNEWERVQERHPGCSLMDIFNQFPDEFDALPLWAEEAYNTTIVRTALLANNYDGAIHAIHGPYNDALAYHAFHPTRLTFIEAVSG